MQRLSVTFSLICGLIILCSATNLQIANITYVITGYGYPVEVHQAVTSDGFQLTLHRIPHGLNRPPIKGVALLQHGLTDSSAGLCLNSPQESLPFILADQGYDVWLGNNRGNGYSMSNVNFGPSDPRFWDFSWDEMALIDFPTNINYVLSVTKAAKISYIGHSQGTIQAFAGLCSNPSLADKLNVFVALAPVAYVGGITLEIFQVLARLDLDELLQLLGVKEFYLPTIVHDILPEFCKFEPRECGFGGSFFYGGDSYLNDTRLDFYTLYEPFPTSTKNIIHWAQGVRDGLFQRFDYGTTGNILHYGQATPPQYLLSSFPANLPLILVTGGIDGLADPADVSKLIAQLPSNANYKILNRPDYGHLDPLLGYDAYQLTYPFVIQELDTYSSS